jgi:hypothetical protein
MLASPQSSRPSPPTLQQPNLSSQVSSSVPSVSLSTPKFLYSSPTLSISKPPIFSTSTGSTGDVHDFLARKLLMEAKSVEESEKIRRRAAEDEIEMLKRAILGR